MGGRGGILGRHSTNAFQLLSYRHAPHAATGATSAYGREEGCSSCQRRSWQSGGGSGGGAAAEAPTPLSQAQPPLGGGVIPPRSPLSMRTGTISSAAAPLGGGSGAVCLPPSPSAHNRDGWIGTRPHFTQTRLSAAPVQFWLGYANNSISSPQRAAPRLPVPLLSR